MNLDQSLINCILTEEFILELANTHQESLKDKIEPLVAPELMESSSKWPEKGMTDHYGIL